jgi:hypothetical protein
MDACVGDSTSSCGEAADGMATVETDVATATVKNKRFIFQLPTARRRSSGHQHMD